MREIRALRQWTSALGRHHESMTDFAPETASVLGGWDQRYVRVIDVKVDGDAAAALIDPNGDGADLNVDLYRLDSNGDWVGIASSNGSTSDGEVLATWTDNDCLILSRTERAFE